MRTIGVVTVARSDFGIYRPLLRRIREAPELSLALYLSGMHLSPRFGHTGDEVEQLTAEGEIVARVEMLLSSDRPSAIGKSMGMGTIGFSQAFQEEPPDILVVLGDRFEMHAAVVAALPFLIPVAHIAGGAVTEGAIDDAMRHSITKLSHLHFTETAQYGERLVRMGESPDRVYVTGAIGLDNLREMELFTPQELSERTGFELSQPPLLVTFHPVTREYEQTADYIQELLAALDMVDEPVVFTYPNADTYSHIIIESIRDYASTRSDVWFVENLGTRTYFSLMAHAAAMVGNSSSGIVEAPSLGLPAVNIGTRQKGRVFAENVIAVDYDRQSIEDGIQRALDPSFQREAKEIENPYGDGYAAERIVKVLAQLELGSEFTKKGFYDS